MSSMVPISLILHFSISASTQGLKDPRWGAQGLLFPGSSPTLSPGSPSSAGTGSRKGGSVSLLPGLALVLLGCQCPWSFRCPNTTCLGPTRPFPPGAVRSLAVRPLRQGSGQMSQARVAFLGAGHIGDPPILAPAGILVLHSEAGCPLLPQSVLPSLRVQWHKGLCIRVYPAGE